MHIDLSLLLEKDQFADQPLQFANKNGKLTLSTALLVLRSNPGLTGNKAFHMFIEIYCLKYPNLLQYVNLLKNLADKFPFSHVYTHNKEFRLEMEQAPNTTWNVIDTPAVVTVLSWS